MIDCIIIEDQPPAQRILKNYIDKVPFLRLAGVFDSAIEALEFIQSNKVDLLFLDIHLPQLSGLEFLEVLRPTPHVIFTTAFSEYALKGYELNVTDYLLKPFSFERFLKAVSKIQPTVITKDSGTTMTESSLFVKSGHDYVKIDTSDILHIQSDGDYTHVVTKHKKHLVHHTLKYWLEVLPSSSFYQVHKSYIIRTDAVSKVSGNQIHIGETIVPLGRAFKERFVQDVLKDKLIK